MVQSLASRLRLRLPCAWVLESVKKGPLRPLVACASCMHKEGSACDAIRSSLTYLVASHAACTRSGRGICEM